MIFFLCHHLFDLLSKGIVPLFHFWGYLKADVCGESHSKGHIPVLLHHVVVQLLGCVQLL